MRCGDCIHRHPDERPGYEGAGQCRRYPPQMLGGWSFDGSGANVIEQHFPWIQADDWCGEFALKPAPDPTEFAEVFNPDLSVAPHDKVLMGQLADGTEAPMLWWHNWPGWREAFVGSAVGAPLAPIAWRPLTEAEDVFDDIPF